MKTRRIFCEILLSLPLWKCGLKRKCSKALIYVFLSLPLRKCGLKQEQKKTIRMLTSVTFLVGVEQVNYKNKINSEILQEVISEYMEEDTEREDMLVGFYRS